MDPAPARAAAPARGIPSRGSRFASVAAIAVGVGLLAVWVWSVARAAGATVDGSGPFWRESGSLLLVALSPGNLVTLGLGTLLVVVGRRRRAAARAPAEPDGAARAPAEPDGAARARGAWAGAPVAVPSDEIERGERELAACLRCGSLDVRPLTLGDGLFAMGGETLAWVCDRCAWRGAPLVFANGTAYREFVKALHEGEAEASEAAEPAEPAGRAEA